MHADSTTDLIRVQVPSMSSTEPVGRNGGVWTLKKKKIPIVTPSIPLDTLASVGSQGH